MSTPDVLKDLQDRVTALENQLAAQTPADSLTPNVITYADGQVGADFSGDIRARSLIDIATNGQTFDLTPTGQLSLKGTISALGLSIPEGVGILGQDNTIVWNRAAGGAMVAQIGEEVSGGGPTLRLMSQAAGADILAAAILEAQTQAAAQSASLQPNAQAGAGNTAIFAHTVGDGGNQLVTILDDKGRSGFGRSGLGAGASQNSSAGQGGWAPGGPYGLLSIPITIANPNGANVLIVVSGSAYAAAVGAVCWLGVGIDNVHYVDVCRFYFNQAADHQIIGHGSAIVPNVSAGAHTAWLFLSVATAQIDRDTNDYLNLTALELP